MEITFADHTELKAKGRNFICAECPEATKERRRCREDRENFTEDDDPTVWPMYVSEPSGELYGFCPAKATWDRELQEKFRVLLIGAETGAMISEGGIVTQPAWWIDLLGWFIPRYQQVKLSVVARMFIPRKGLTGANRTTPGNKAASHLKGSQPPPRGRQTR